MTRARALKLARVGVGVSGLLGAISCLGTMLAAADNLLQRPLFTWMPALTPVSSGLMFALLVCGSVLLVLGPHPRPAAGLLACGFLFAFAWEQQTYSNHVALVALLCVWVALSPRNDPSLLMTQLSVCYLFAALSKMNHEFLSGRTLPQYIGLDLTPSLWVAVSVAAVTVELALAIGLWIPAVRLPVAGLGLLFHLAIPVLMSGNRYGLASFSLTCLCLYPLFLTRSAQHRPRQRQPLQRRRVAAEPEV